jgi:hypothetical protein
MPRDRKSKWLLGSFVREEMFVGIKDDRENYIINHILFSYLIFQDFMLN